MAVITISDLDYAKYQVETHNTKNFIENLTEQQQSSVKGGEITALVVGGAVVVAAGLAWGALELLDHYQVGGHSW